MKAVLQFDATPGFLAQLAQACPDWLEIEVIPETDLARFSAALPEVEALLHALEPVTATVIAAAPHLRLIQKIGVGVNTIDLDAARAHGVGVANMPGSNTQAVVESTLTLLFSALRRVRDYDRSVRNGTWWSVPPPVIDAVGEVGGRTIGLIGYGAVPRRLAPVLRALGANVVYWSRTPRPEAEGVAEWRALDDLLRESDIISLHIPLTDETAGIIDASALDVMKPGAVLINTARGGLVDQGALVAALQSGHLAAAGLDVLATEPVDPNDPILKLDNVVLMPHVAWLTPETIGRSIVICIENCRRVREGEPLLHEIVPSGPRG